MLQVSEHLKWVDLEILVPYGHTDQMGHVYYGNYLLYFEMARNQFMRQLGYTYRQCEQDGIFVPVVEAHVYYRGRVFYDDVIVVSTAMEIVSGTRMKFQYRITRKDEAEELLTEGYSFHAAVDATGRVRRIPVKLKELLDTFTGHSPA